MSITVLGRIRVPCRSRGIPLGREPALGCLAIRGATALSHDPLTSLRPNHFRLPGPSVPAPWSRPRQPLCRASTHDRVRLTPRRLT